MLLQVHSFDRNEVMAQSQVAPCRNTTLDPRTGTFVRRFRASAPSCRNERTHPGSCAAIASTSDCPTDRAEHVVDA
jgi:hypothetical protein